jgi:hypothetical protein
MKTKYKGWWSALPVLLLAASLQCLAQNGNVVEDPASSAGAAADTAAPVLATVLSDRVHQITASLEGSGIVHNYSFTSVRGQNVLLATPDTDGFNVKWRMEYRTGSDEWTFKRHRGPQVFDSLQPGAVIEVRVTPVPGAVFDKADYKMVFGSSPRMNYDLHHEDGFLRVPYGLTEPPFLATQAVTQTLLDIRFTDSKGYPLEGGVAYFEMKLSTLNQTPVKKKMTSDASGSVQEMLNLGTCQGGKAAGYFTHRQNGRNTWATRYIAGTYYAENVLLEELADKPHIYNIGHICKRTLVNWSRN